jgi:hypothetical protein
MLDSRLAILTAVALASAVPVHAQDVSDISEPPTMSCDDKGITSELQQLCDGIEQSYRDALSAPPEVTGTIRSAPLPSLVRRPINSELIGGGFDYHPDRTNPFASAPDRSVGVRVKGADSPVQLSTEMVQPGDPEAQSRLNWELKAERGASAVQSGMFVGGAAAGTYERRGGGENVSAFAGVRGVTQPYDGVRFGSELAPRVSVTDDATASMSFEPKLSTSAEFGRIGTSDFRGSINADVGYQLPVGGDPSLYSGFRLSITPR